MGDLSFGAIRTGVIYGFLRDIATFKEEMESDKVIFCFDYGLPKRRLIYPGYKARRHKPEMTIEEKDARGHLQLQVDKLRERYLEKIGYKNVWYQDGYEADDLIAYACHRLPKGDEAIIVSADGDLYQLLSDRISMFSPNKRKYITCDSFARDWKIHPKYWYRIKAMCGCKSDEIPGIKGVGELTAIKFFNARQTGDHNHKRFSKITSTEGISTFKRNLELVRLPLEGVGNFPFRDDRVSREGWESVCNELGIKSIRLDKGFTTSRSAANFATFER